MATKLTVQSDYKQLLYRIKSWVDDAGPVAEDLRRVRDEKLFRAGGYKTFEEFCQAELGYTSRWANQIVKSAAAVEEIEEQIVPEKLAEDKLSGTIVPENEAQARELAKLPKDKRKKVWAEASKDGKPTAAKVREAAEAIAKPKAGKISGGTSFDVAEIEAATPARKPKPGKPTIGTDERKSVVKACGVCQRFVDKHHLGEGWVNTFRDFQDVVRNA